MNNIYLIGMMGSGKTSTGRSLAKLLKFQFVDLDEELIKETGQSINQIFASQGEPYFREMESKILNRISQLNNCVIATGGGVVLKEENNQCMKKTGRIIYLKTNIDVLWERVKRNQSRPLIATGKPRQTLESIMLTRAKLYESKADDIFITDQKNPETVATEICEKVK